MQCPFGVFDDVMLAMKIITKMSIFYTDPLRKSRISRYLEHSICRGVSSFMRFSYIGIIGALEISRINSTLVS